MGFDGWVKRYWVVAVCLLIGIAAYFQASGLTNLIGVILAPASGVPAFAGRAFVPPLPGDADRDTHATSILERNPFDHVTGPLGPFNKGKADGQEEEEGPPGADWYRDPACEIAKVVLIASSEDPAWSFAAILGPDGKTVLRRRGEDFFGGKVTFIGDQRPSPRPEAEQRGLWDRVWLTGPNGTRCQLQLGGKLPAKMAMPPPPPPGGPPNALAGKIRQRGEHEFDVDRTAVDALIANPAELMKIRVMPVKEGDRVSGLKLSGIRPNSLLSSLGIQNGDQLTNINGFEMNDPQKMLEAYSKLMRADHLTASVVRNGQPMNLDFSIK